MTSPAEDGALSPMEYVKAKGFIDFPHAWMIARRSAPECHHSECSFNVTGGAILCDCEVLTKSPEYVLAYGRDPLDCPPDGGCGGCGNWPEHCVCSLGSTDWKGA